MWDNHGSRITRKGFFICSGSSFINALMASSIPLLLFRCSDTPGGISLDLTRKKQLMGLRNTLRMGHCAPAVMRTLMEIEGIPFDRMVLLSSGLPGGIGNLGRECGGITSSILFLGKDSNSWIKPGVIPPVLTQGRYFMEYFKKSNGSFFCTDIRKAGGMKNCIKAICTSPEAAIDIKSGSCGKPFLLNKKTLDAFSTLQESFRASSFHCAHTVLRALKDLMTINDMMLNSSWGFIGGTLLTGNTCGALVAGVFAIGMLTGEIENSYFRVIKMHLSSKEKASSFDANKFNRAMFTGQKLGHWFERRFGSISCRLLTKTDFESPIDVKKYIQKGGIEYCRSVGIQVVQQVRALLHATA